MIDYYQLYAKEYHDNTFQIDPESILNPLVRHLLPESKILDIGCASGRDLLWLKKKGFQIQGLDRSAALVRMAREYSGCNVIEADFEVFDFSCFNVDALVIIGALVHIPHDRLEKALKSFLSAFQREGHILITLKEGGGVRLGKDGRSFTLWGRSQLEMIFRHLNLSVLDFSRQVSKINPDDIWLGHVLKYSGS